MPAFFYSGPGDNKRHPHRFLVKCDLFGRRLVRTHAVAVVGHQHDEGVVQYAALF